MEPSIGINDGSAMSATLITADALRPSFSKWEMNMDTGLMTLYFGEPVNATSFTPSHMSFQAVENLGTDPSANIISLVETNTSVLTPDGTTQQIQLGNVNMNAIKALSPLGTLQSKLFLSFATPAYTDMAGNLMSLAYVSIYDAKPCTVFTPDTTPPRLVSFDLNMNTEELRLVFTETVNTHQFEVRRKERRNGAKR